MSIERTKEDKEQFAQDMARLRKQEHTPGPWEVDPGEHRAMGGERVYKVCLRSGGLIADVSAWWVDTESAKANAALIARAPAMAELLERVSEFLDGQSDVVDGDQGGPTPNRAMSLKREVDVLLGRETDGF